MKMNLFFFNLNRIIFSALILAQYSIIFYKKNFFNLIFNFLTVKFCFESYFCVSLISYVKSCVKSKDDIHQTQNI